MKSLKKVNPSVHKYNFWSIYLLIVCDCINAKITEQSSCNINYYCNIQYFKRLGTNSIEKLNIETLILEIEDRR